MDLRISKADLWRYFQVLLLAIACGTGTFARSSIGPLQESMRTALGLNDNQTALLQGMALALPLALGSIPMGVLADRTSRTRLMQISLGLAICAAVVSAFATDFSMMLIGRFLTGVSIPGLAVATYSIAGDLFPPNARGRATTVIALGELGGAPLAFALGGVLLVNVGTIPALNVFGHLGNWNKSLLVMALLIVPVLLATFLVREPVRTEKAVQTKRLRESWPELWAVWPELWNYRRVAIPLQLGRATLFIADGAVFVWGAPFLSRRFHLAPDYIGGTLALVLLVAGILGPLFGGPLVDWCQRNGGPRRAMQVLAVLAFACVPIGLFALLPTVAEASLALGVFLTLGGAIGAAALALTLVVIPSHIRGLNLGISLVVGSMFFIGIAPLTVSALSGALGGPMQIGKALAIVCGAASLANALVFTFTARYFPDTGTDVEPDARGAELAPTI